MTRTTTPYLLATCLTAMLLSPLAYSHTDEVLDARASANGGQTRMAGAYHFELVLVRDSATAKSNPVLVYVTNHADEPLSSAGATGTVILLGTGTKAQIKLVADGDNRLRGSGVYASTEDLKAVTTITMPEQAGEQARFTPLAPRTPSPEAAPEHAHEHGHDHKHDHKHD